MAFECIGTSCSSAGEILEKICESGVFMSWVLSPVVHFSYKFRRRVISSTFFWSEESLFLDIE